MNQEPLVSVITPCYNGENYMKRMLDSVLTQNYHNVEFFFINDGSTDKTHEILLRYKPLLEKKFTRFVYVNKKENEGVCAAFNSVLKEFSGKYLAWPDSDDILYPNFLLEKVKFMENNPQFGLCCCGLDYADENDIRTITHSTQRLITGTDNLFKDFILEKNSAMAGPALAYFVKSEHWISSNPERQIYNNRLAANWQMLLPIMYESKCGYINKKLACVIERTGSASRSIANTTKRIYMHKDILFHTLDRMDISSSEKNKYKKMVNRKYRFILLLAKLQQYPWLWNNLKRIKKFLTNKK